MGETEVVDVPEVAKIAASVALAAYSRQSPAPQKASLKEDAATAASSTAESEACEQSPPKGDAPAPAESAPESTLPDAPAKGGLQVATAGDEAPVDIEGSKSPAGSGLAAVRAAREAMEGTEKNNDEPAPEEDKPKAEPQEGDKPKEAEKPAEEKPAEDAPPAAADA
eukprot:CAMPEP_0204331914 /NCGR_PEP_ID=MMETSP0469-20131031/16073_1 /ASSEMBLY_ACC=CAM_ASM_000384 /TAXON_ID=2969 /ORGANISM="Oxyrrhis marina" /LENGTH=166 /DNA_ID=CAMNT_0051314995 /DNA_START=39 /DNA_END=539 /DNA_ORIENTATION=-